MELVGLKILDMIIFVNFDPSLTFKKRKALLIFDASNALSEISFELEVVLARSYAKLTIQKRDCRRKSSSIYLFSYNLGSYI